MEYEKRIVCFMDIVGFKQLISKSKKDIELRNKILALLNDVEKIHSEFCYKRKITVMPESGTDNIVTPINAIDVGLDTEMSFFFGQYHCFL